MGFFFFFFFSQALVKASGCPLPLSRPTQGPGTPRRAQTPVPPPSPGLMEGERSPPARGTPRPPAVEWAALIYRRGSLSTRPRHTQIPRNPAPELGGGHGLWGALGPPLPPPPPPGDPDSEVKMPALFLAGSEKKKNSPSPASHGPPLPRGTGVGHPRAGEPAEPEVGGGGILSTPPGHGLPPPPPRAVPLGWGGWCWFSLYFAIRPGPFPAGPFAGVFQRGKLKG